MAGANFIKRLKAILFELNQFRNFVFFTFSRREQMWLGQCDVAAAVKISIFFSQSTHRIHCLSRLAIGTDVNGGKFDFISYAQLEHIPFQYF